MSLHKKIRKIAPADSQNFNKKIRRKNEEGLWGVGFYAKIIKETNQNKNMPLPMPKRVPKVGFYYHYKHDPSKGLSDHAYEVMGVGFHTEEDARSGEEHFLIYRPLYDQNVYKASKDLDIACFDARPLEMWMEDVEKDGKKFPRFQEITDTVVIAELERIREEMY